MERRLPEGCGDIHRDVRSPEGPGRQAGVPVAVLVTVVSLAAPASAGAHPQSTLDTETSATEEIADLWWFMLIASTVVVAVVVALTLLAILRRHGRGDRAARWMGRPWLVAVAGLAVPLAILSVLFVLTLGTLQETAPGHLRPELTIDVTARQWFWDVRYPESGAVTANEIHVPADTSVRVRLETEDVLHSFWVPSLNRKVDAIPGRTTSVTFHTTDPGIHRGQCAEYCGVQHANMALEVIVEPPEEFRAWLDRQAEPAREADGATVTRGSEVFFSAGCANCHTVRGTAADGDVGPDLTHVASRRRLAAATIPNTRGSLGGWVLDPQHIKPGALMPGVHLDGEETQALLDYLESLR